MSENKGIQKKNDSKKKSKVARLAVIVLIFSILCCGYALFSGPSVQDEAVVDEATGDSAQSVTRTDKPASTSTPNIAPSFSEIAENYNSMTDAQWEKYAAPIAGAYAKDWEGTVTEVDVGEIMGGYSISIDAGRDSFLSEVNIGDVSEELALSLNKGQRVRFSGTIDYASNILGLTIVLNGDTIEITPLD
jgi:hypothetical protein